MLPPRERDRFMKRSFWLGLMVPAALVAVPLLAGACGGGNDNLPPPPPPPPPTATPTASASAMMGEPDAAAPTPAPPAPVLVLGTASEDPKAPLPTVKITSPRSNQVVPSAKAEDFAVKLDVKNWKTAMGAQHVHLILDNHPYKPIYDTKKPVKLSELLGGAKLGDGEHVLVAFPSRPNHESVKTKNAMTVVEFWVGKKGKASVDIKKPMLVYSRPKGDYKGPQASHVLVDFYLANDTLGEGKDHVNITVTGPGIEKELTAKADKFGPPYYLDNLQDGTYTVKLDLMDKDGKPVPGDWNSTTRTINVNHEAQPEPMPAPAAADAKPAAKGDKGKTPEKKPAKPAPKKK